MLVVAGLFRTILLASSLVSLSTPAWGIQAEMNADQSRDKQQFLQKSYYILGPGDEVFVDVTSVDGFDSKTIILSDGTVSLPVVGTVVISGLTISQATIFLNELYGRSLVSPQVQVSVIAQRPLRVSIIGEIERPGVYSLTAKEKSSTEGSPQTSIEGAPTVIDAIQKAGGITQDADITSVVLQRRLPGESARYKETNLNLLTLMTDGSQADNPYLFDGDILKIGKADVSVKQVSERSAFNLSPQVISVYIVGEVEGPGKIDLTAGTTLSQALMAAGGPKGWRANQGKVELMRISRSGEATRSTYKLNLSQGASNRLNPILKDKDTVLVRRSPLAVTSDTINAIGQPLTSAANVLTLIKLLND